MGIPTKNFIHRAERCTYNSLPFDMKKVHICKRKKKKRILSQFYVQQRRKKSERKQ